MVSGGGGLVVCTLDLIRVSENPALREMRFVSQELPRRRLLLISGRETLGYDTYRDLILDVEEHVGNDSGTLADAGGDGRRWAVECMTYSVEEPAASLVKRATALMTRGDSPFDAVLGHSQGGLILAACLPSLAWAETLPFLIFSHVPFTRESIGFEAAFKAYDLVPTSFDLRNRVLELPVPAFLLYGPSTFLSGTQFWYSKDKQNEYLTTRLATGCLLSAPPRQLYDLLVMVRAALRGEPLRHSDRLVVLYGAADSFVDYGRGSHRGTAAYATKVLGCSPIAVEGMHEPFNDDLPLRRSYLQTLARILGGAFGEARPARSRGADTRRECVGGAAGVR